MNETAPPATPVLPTGTLTFLFTDVEGSSRLWEQHPHQMRVAMAQHDGLIESCVARLHGTIVRPRGEGDSRFAVFPLASDAVAASSAIHQALAAEPWTLPMPLKVRIALHTGEADLRNGDYYGTAVNRCARIRNMAHGGQTLVSLATASILQDGHIDGLILRDLGECKIKDFERPEKIYQVVTPGVTEEFSPLRIEEVSRGNLPVVLTSFIGRESEIAHIKQLISSLRMLTILGAGGSGKTRLALQVAADLRDAFAHGIWFVDLAPLSNPELLVPHLLNVLCIREEEGLPLMQALITFLRDRALLLILDNCEHLLPALSQLTEAMLLGAPSIKILATSREALGITGETIWKIPTLTFPDPSGPLSLADITRYEAVELFLARAKAVKSDLELTEQDALAVAQICAHLDGIPLAIELAAARTRVLAAGEIASRLGDRFRLLVGGRTMLKRQQTLQALIDWSYDLLTDNERALLRRMSVFAGGCTLPAIEEVCSGGSIEAADVLDLLSALIDKSLVIAQPQRGSRRYGFLETIHQYGQERLSESGEARKFARKHACYFLALVEASFGELWGPKQGFWLPQLEEEYDNLRRALEWMDRRVSRKKMFLGMTGRLWRFWSIRGYFSEGRIWLERALEKYPEAPSLMLAHSLRGAGILTGQQGDYVQARKLHEQSLDYFRQIDDKLGAARELAALAQIAHIQGHFPRSLELSQESLALMREIDDREGVAVALGQMGIIARERGQYEEARRLLSESLKLSREIDDKQLIARALKNLGIAEFYLSEYQHAMELFEAALPLYRELKDKLGISNVLQQMGYVAKDLGDFRRAISLFDECIELKQKLGERLGIAYALANLAEIAFYQGRYPAVSELAGQSLALFQELGAKRGIIFSMGLEAYAAHYQGRYQIALLAAQECLRLSDEIEAPRSAAHGKAMLGLIAYADGDLQRAQGLFNEALDIFLKVRDRRSMAMTWINLARTAYRQGQYERAVDFVNESLVLSRELGNRWTVGFALEIMGLLKRSRGNYQRALELFRESLQISVEQENQQGIANCLAAVAGLAALMKQPAHGASLFAVAQKTREMIGASMASGDQVEYEHYLAMVRQQMDEVLFQAAWDRGYGMTPEQAVDELGDWLQDAVGDSKRPELFKPSDLWPQMTID